MEKAAVASRADKHTHKQEDCLSVCWEINDAVIVKQGGNSCNNSMLHKT